ncbi:short-chain dehydrogenase/reductase SDR [Monoraphidium neglectum]|uniref:Short-chain dehydrogenase/reductase SDR n=1 Tax=Monoraphidium neglectum TaxID=145388 RepID=A0A0D2NF54_9CHLO|nr:short-chain dehydrogenase/reductase SDR [Monoraphidium neglectum]KIZ03766.1 short-chain dehydrogenase/reductase SDR [Monoraphidium neglectum]|eukprot:XP_013902785.1 short-chain dehydrogenase/reductase SDR [Monoraphidium neglectum]
MTKVEGLGRSALPLSMDVRDRGSVDDAMREVERVYGGLDVLVANAGILGLMQPPEELDEENYKNVFAVNVDGVLHATRAAYPLLKKSGCGKIVITSSVAGLTGYGPQLAYCASKGAVIPLAKSLALAWAKDGINVNVVLPGAVNTPFTTRILDDPHKLSYILNRIPLGRLAEPEDIVGPILFLSSHAADYCTGSLLVVDGGGTSRAMAQ